MKTDEIRAEARAACKYTFITQEAVDEVIDRAEYFHVPGTGTMVCAIVLKNGFTVVDHSACIDPRNFKEELAKRLAFSKARDKIFHFLAFTACGVLAMIRHAESLDKE